MRTTCTLLAIPLAFLLAASCGNGNGNGNGDTTPPAVSSTDPADGATDVPVDAPLTATFSEAMDPASISTSTFTLEETGGASVTGTVAYDGGTRTATFTPGARLAWNTDYTATVTTGVEDEAGNALASDHVWTFLSFPSPPGWESVGGQVSPASPESEDPTMLVLGTVPAVGYRHGSFQALLNIWDGSSWGTPQPDPAGGEMNGSGYSTPDFCVKGDAVYVAFSLAGDATANDDTFYDRIFVHRWTSGTGWEVQNGGAEVSVIWSDPPGGVNAWEPTIACPAAGDPLVAWVEGDVVPDPDWEDGVWVAEVGAASSSRSAYLSRTNPGTYFSAVRTVGIGLDGSGDAVVGFWEESADNQDLTNLFVDGYDGAFSDLGGSLSDDWDYNNVPVPSLASDGGDIYVAYSEANSADNTRHVFVKKYDGSWSTVGGGPVTAFSPSDHYTSHHPDLLIVDGTLWLAWQEADQFEGPFIFVAYFDEGAGEWVVDGDRLNHDTANDALDPSLAYSPTDGYLYVAFEEFTDGHPHVFVKRKRINP